MACIVHTCFNIRGQDKTGNISFHRLPNDPTLKAEWLNLIKRDPSEWYSSNNSICSEHFLPEDILRLGKMKVMRPGAVPSQKLPQTERVQKKSKYHFDDSEVGPPIDLENPPEKLPNTSKKLKVVSVLVQANDFVNSSHSENLNLDTSCPDNEANDIIEDMASLDPESDYHDVPDMVNIKQELDELVGDQMEEEGPSQSDDQETVTECVPIKNENMEVEEEEIKIIKREFPLSLDPTTGEMVEMEETDEIGYSQEEEVTESNNLLDGIEDDLEHPEEEEESPLLKIPRRKPSKPNTSRPVTRTTYKCSVCNYTSLSERKVQTHAVQHKHFDKVVINVIHTAQHTKLKLPKPSNYTVEMLRNIQFPFLPQEGKLHILKVGRPTPLSQTLLKQEIYDRYSWVCGCAHTHKYFCYPCLLFSKDTAGGSWVKGGVADIGNFPDKVEAHLSSMAHLNSILEFTLHTQEKSTVKPAEPEKPAAESAQVRAHNERVKRNRAALSKIVNCIKFCTEFSLPLGGLDGKTALLDGLINLNSELNVLLKGPFELEAMQKELLDSILQVCREHIKKEITEAKYVSLILDEISDLSSKYRMSVVFRYLLPDGTPVERFWGFIESCWDKDETDSLAEFIIEILGQMLDAPEQLISQSYNGIIRFTSDRFAAIHKQIRDIHKYAYYVHCYTQGPSVIIANVTSQTPEGKVFVSNLIEIANFLSDSFFLTISEILWNDIGSKLIIASKKVTERKEELIKNLKKITKESNLISRINQASAIQRIVLDPGFTYWNTVFQRLNEHADIFFYSVKQATAMPKQLPLAVEAFKKEIQQYIAQLYQDPDLKASFEQMKNGNTQCLGANALRVSKAKETCDALIRELNKRFSFLGQFYARFLFQPKMFATFQSAFPTYYFYVVVQAYPFIDQVRLKNELKVIYNKQGFIEMSGPEDILKFFIENGFKNLFTATIQLLQVIITTPMMIDVEQRNVGAAKRVRSLLEKRTRGEELEEALVMMLVEKKMVYEMADFNEAVIQKFSLQKHRKNDFSWKHS